jgi:hypothetical protein
MEVVCSNQEVYEFISRDTVYMIKSVAFNV